jgi:hypothetical protein
MRIHVHRVLVAVLGLCLGCGSGSGDGTLGATDGGADSSTGGGAGTAGGDAAADAASSSTAACDAYIACVAQTTPAGLDAILAAYGKDGSCWAQGDPELCSDACRTGTVAAHKAFPGVEACNVCSTSSDCPVSVPACDAAASRCVECASDGDCKDNALPACDISKHACVACTQSGHCLDPARPVCDAASATCVGCASNADCGGFAGPVCDPSTKQCRGCQVDSECASGACNQGVCAQCKTDAQCGAATPHCTANGRCIECLSDTECGAGVCTLAGTCCGKTACATAGAECGQTIDLACLLSPISCAACEAGNVCLKNHCEPAPAKTCTTSNCSQRCTYVPENNAYECLPLFPSCSSTKPCDQGFYCERFEVNGTTYHQCRVQCLDDDDCARTSGRCKLLHGPTSWGYCG